jgi:hypothetical protein
MAKEESLLSYMDKDESELSDDELLDKLSDEYLDALQKRNHRRIEEAIAPRFWTRFSSYFNEYIPQWKGSDGENPPDAYAVMSGELGQLQAQWMDQVLRGEISLSDEMNEEPES